MSNGNPKFPPVLIYTIVGRACCIGNYGFMPTRVFSVYGEYEGFRREVAEVQQSFENFINYLIEKDLGDYMEPDGFPDNATSFLTWDLIPTAQDIGSAFDLIHHFPKILTQHLLEQVASGYLSSPFTDTMFTRDEYFRFMAEKCRTEEAVESLRMTIALSQMRNKEDRLIAQHGYTTNNVFDNDSGLNFAYSVGLTDKAGFEVIAMAALPLDYLHGLVCKVASSYISELPNITQGIYEGWMTNQNGQQMRFEVVEVAAGQVLGKLINNTRGEVKRVMQILISDKNNILPLEEGYDVEFKQPAFQQLRNIKLPQ